MVVRKNSKVIFLDRDGVINKDLLTGYITSWDEFSFLPGAIDAIKKLNQSGYKIYVISNQAGVAKGLYTEAGLETITRNMMNIIESKGGFIEKVYYCIHRNEDNCSCRKPKPGLFDRVVKEQNISINQSETYFIGDGITDVQAGQSFGLKTILLLCGKTTKEKYQESGIEPDKVCFNLMEAVDHILK